MFDKPGLFDEVRAVFTSSSMIAHGFDHVERVAGLATIIAAKEAYPSLDEAEVAGILHDIGRALTGIDKGHGPAGVSEAAKLLDKYTTFDNAAKTRILNAIRDHSGRTAVGKLTHILKDADKLDGMGAHGIARGFQSASTLPLYDPSNITPTESGNRTTATEHLYFQIEWMDMFETDTGRDMARRRYELMTILLEELKREYIETGLSPTSLT